MEDLQQQIQNYKKEKRKVVIYLDNQIVKKVSSETKDKLLSTLYNSDCKVVTSDNVNTLLLYKKPVVIRYGIIPTCVSTKLTAKGSTIISGDF